MTNPTVYRTAYSTLRYLFYISTDEIPLKFTDHINLSSNYKDNLNSNTNKMFKLISQQKKKKISFTDTRVYLFTISQHRDRCSISNDSSWSLEWLEQYLQKLPYKSWTGQGCSFISQVFLTVTGLYPDMLSRDLSVVAPSQNYVFRCEKFLPK